MGRKKSPTAAELATQEELKKTIVTTEVKTGEVIKEDTPSTDANPADNNTDQGNDSVIEGTATVITDGDTQLAEGTTVITDKPDETLAPVTGGEEGRNGATLNLDNDGQLAPLNTESDKAAPVVTKEDEAAGTAVATNETVIEGSVGKHIDASPMGEYCKTVDAYADKMGPNHIVTPLDIATSQMELYQAITGILNNFEGSKFVTAFGGVLEIMHTKPAAFADNLLFRGVANMRVPPQVQTRYENILILMSSTANPENRGTALKTIDMSVLCRGFTPDVEQKIKGFYSNFLE